ncbi:MAG TPA: hypothetical protein VIZ65_16915 [Cellvibrionaceae bacterium]
MTPKELFKVASLSGYVRIAPGLCLSSQKSLQEEQKIWGHDDPNKLLDLNSHPFWIYTDDHKTLLGIRDEHDLKRFLNIDQEKSFEIKPPVLSSSYSLLY